MKFYAGSTPEKTIDSKTMLAYIPHGINENKFFPIAADDYDTQAKVATLKQHLFVDDVDDIKFIVFYNARNLRRKMTNDTLLAYDYFLSQLSEEEQNQCRILLHTTPVEEHGTDLLTVLKDLLPNVKAVFSNKKVEVDVLNMLYNMSDVTINLSSNEGFGLGTCESLMAGVPIIVNVTGGLQDQCGFMDDDGNYLDPDVHYNLSWGTNNDGKYKRCGEWAFPVFPNNVSLQGSPATPYISDDRCDWKEAGTRILEVFRMSKEERKRRGLLGREFVLGPGKMSSTTMGGAFIENIDKVFANWTPRSRYTIMKTR